MYKRVPIWEMPNLAIHEEDGSITHPKFVEYDEQWVMVAKAIEQAENLGAGIFEKTFYQMRISLLEHELNRVQEEASRLKNRFAEVEGYLEGATHTSDMPPKNGPYLAYYLHENQGWGVHPVVFKDGSFYQRAVILSGYYHKTYPVRVDVEKWWYLPSELNLLDTWDYQEWMGRKAYNA